MKAPLFIKRQIYIYISVVCRCFYALCLVFLLPVNRAPALESVVVDQNKVKAVVVYNLSRFVEWPETVFDSEEPRFSICLLGESPLEYALPAMEGKRMQKHKVVFRKLEKLPAEKCQVVFISFSEKEKLSEILPVLHQEPILSVSDIKGFAQQGGVVGLLQTGTRIRFEINVQAAKQSGLSIRAPLLELAELVDPSGTEE